MAKLSEILFGKKDKIKQVSNLNRPQQELLDLILQGIASGDGALGNLFGEFNQEAFQEGITQPALRQFQEEILPAIQEKFISGNQVGGSGMNRAALKAGTDLQSRLAQLMYDAQQRHQQTQLSGIQTALGTRPFENMYQQGQTGIVPSLAQGVTQALVQNALPTSPQALPQSISKAVAG